MRRLLSLLICTTLAFAAFGITGCEKQVSSNAQEAYNAFDEFITALRACGDDPEYQNSPDKQECDKNIIWNSIDAQSKQQVAVAYATLIRIDRIIKQYFDSIEHKQMRAQAGTNFIKDSDQLITNDDIKDFFFRTFKPEKFVFDANTNSGLKFAGDVVENANLVHIKTHDSSQVFTMIRESDGVWRTAIFSAPLSKAFAPIYASETAMREYAKGNLENELKRRAAVREYFNIQAAVQREERKNLVAKMQETNLPDEQQEPQE